MRMVLLLNDHEFGLSLSETDVDAQQRNDGYRFVPPILQIICFQQFVGWVEAYCADTHRSIETRTKLGGSMTIIMRRKSLFGAARFGMMGIVLLHPSYKKIPFA